MTVRDADDQRELLSLASARVRDAPVGEAFYLDGALDLASACRQLAARGQGHCLVRDGDRIGIFTTSDLRDAVMRDLAPAAVALAEAARFDLVRISPDADLFEALRLMVRHRLHRLVVGNGDIVGVLDQLDLMGFVANHSHVIALQIDAATGIEQLGEAASRIDTMLALMHDSGIKVDRIARSVCELNARLFGRLWTLVAPPELIAASCLLVMGSEGRGEQLLKTDQDNALLLRDGFEWPGLQQVADRFNAALKALGYPPCPGDIMLSNPLWRQALTPFKDTLREWVYGASAEAPMRLAIFIDSHAVAGDAALLAEARDHLDRILAGSDAFYARFASAIDLFDHQPAFWKRWTTPHPDAAPVDVKKLGIFPIVHGVRALALRHGVRANGTQARLAALVAAGALDAETARDLTDALHALMALRLTHQLRQKEAGQPVDNTVPTTGLGLLERDVLRDAIGIVRRFRALLHRHFRLDAL